MDTYSICVPKIEVWGNKDSAKREYFRTKFKGKYSDDWIKLEKLLPEKECEFHLIPSHKIDIDNICKLYIDAFYEPLRTNEERWPDHNVISLTAEKVFDGSEVTKQCNDVKSLEMIEIGIAFRT